MSEIPYIWKVLIGRLDDLGSRLQNRYIVLRSSFDVRGLLRALPCMYMRLSRCLRILIRHRDAALRASGRHCTVPWRDGQRTVSHTATLKDNERFLQTRSRCIKPAARAPRARWFLDRSWIFKSGRARRQKGQKCSSRALWTLGKQPFATAKFVGRISLCDGLYSREHRRVRDDVTAK